MSGRKKTVALGPTYVNYNYLFFLSIAFSFFVFWFFSFFEALIKLLKKKLLKLFGSNLIVSEKNSFLNEN